MAAAILSARIGIKIIGGDALCGHTEKMTMSADICLVLSSSMYGGEGERF